jgi:hypothetical protein
MQPKSLAGLLLTRQLRSGGWSYFGSQQSSVEATSLAVMALSTESPDAARSGLDQMLDLQRGEGAWPAFVGDSEASWTTALMLCALNGTGEFTSAREKAFHWLVAERGQEAHWLWRWKFNTTDRNVRFDPDKYGWPWISGSASWVIRTHLPQYSLEAAAGRFGEQMSVDPEGWVEVRANIPLSDEMFVIHVTGYSMEPLIPNDSLCALRARIRGHGTAKYFYSNITVSPEETALR